jgi:basic membrane protein A
MIFAMAYGSTPADANWNPVCDIAGDGGVLEPDGVIDFEDLMIFAMHYGGYALTTSIDPSGSGYITLNPSGGTYTVGTQVTITAHPYSGYEFDYWSGDASGISTSVTITIINSNKNITAHFIPIDTIKIGLVFDIGGRGDKSFNDSAYRGIEWAAADFNIEHTELEPEEDEDREICLRNLAETGYDLVIGVGFLFTDAISTVADEFPDAKFAIIDGFIPDIPNVVSLLFKEHEGSFLVGMIAGMRAMEDGKDIVGFVGGMDIPLIHKFEAGYRAGVQYVFPECTILSDYAGDTPEAFADPAKGKELALAQYDNGAWVIYHASGLTGAGVFEAGKERKRYVIGVDSNQNYMGYIEETEESFGLTSMLKQVDVTVYLTIKSVVEGKFTGGIEIFGLDRSVTIGGTLYYGVDYALDEYNEDSVTSVMIAQVEEARDKIRNGEIIVPEE